MFCSTVVCGLLTVVYWSSAVFNAVVFVCFMLLFVCLFVALGNLPFPIVLLCRSGRGN